MDILVIGGIAAGASIAAKAKRTNPAANVTIIEKEDYLSFGACGLPFYLGGQFEDGNRMMVRSVEDTRKAGIEVLIKHEVLSVDFFKKEVKIKNLEDESVFTRIYDKLAIASGARPVLPNVEGIDAENVYTVTRLREVEKLKKDLEFCENIVIVGAGFISIEVADELSRLGKKLVIIQRSQQIMKDIYDVEISNRISEALLESGVSFMPGNAFMGFELENGRVRAVLTDKNRFKADLVIVAMGFAPQTLIFDDPRLEKLANGAIKIDEYGMTSIKDVYAAGDCAGVYNILEPNYYAPMATYANKMGRIVGENIVSDKQRAYIGALSSSSIKIGEYGAGKTGLTERKARELGYDVGAKLVEANNHSDYLPGQSKMAIKLVYDKSNRKILGGQIFGKDGAVERLNALTVAVFSGLTLDQLGFMDFQYSPAFASTWEALNIAGNAVK